MARILVTWLSRPTSFHPLAALIPPFAALLRLFAAHVVHLIADLLRTVLRLFLPYAVHAMQQFASDASTLTGQIGPLANFPIQSSDGPFHWTTARSNMEGWTHFFLLGLAQNRPHVHVHNIFCPSLEQTHHLWTIGFLRDALLVVSPHCLKFHSFYPVFTQEPNNILFAINISCTKYKRYIKQRYRAYNLIFHLITNRMPIFGVVYFRENSCTLHCLSTFFCIHHIQQSHCNSENLCW